MDELKQILHQRRQSNVSSQMNEDAEAMAVNKELNEWDIEEDLDPSVEVDQAFLVQLAE